MERTPCRDPRRSRTTRGRIGRRVRRVVLDRPGGGWWNVRRAETPADQGRHADESGGVCGVSSLIDAVGGGGTYAVPRPPPIKDDTRTNRAACAACRP